MDFIDWSGVECLNQSTSHSLPNALKQVIYSNSLSLDFNTIDLPNIMKLRKDFAFYMEKYEFKR
jgi:hypothetical protein